MKSKWSVLAVYENAEARGLAVRFCDALMQRFWAEYSFELKWRDWGDLERSVLPDQAEKQSQVIVVATNTNKALPKHVKNWLELAVHGRGEREGLVVGLPGSEENVGAQAAGNQMYLRRLAHQSGMDYLTRMPETLAVGVPDSLDACNDRATRITNVLERILNRPVLPPRLM